MRPPATSRRPSTRAGLALVAVVVSGWLALVEVFWLPLRVGRVLVPVSILAAVVGNLLLVSLAYRLSGSRLVAVLPAAVWLTIALGATMRRPEGDLVLVGGGAAGAVNLAFLLLGMASAALAVARVVATRARPRRAADEAAAVSRPPAGSGTGGAR